MKVIHLTVLILVLLSFRFIQNEKTYRIPIKEGKNSGYAEVFRVNPKNITANKNYFYHWAESRQVYATQGGFSGMLLHGPYEMKYENGNLMSKGLFKNGLKTGEWKKWHSNGVLSLTGSYQNGQKNGRFVYYDSSGTLLKEARFKNDLLNGKLKLYHQDGTSSSLHYNNGELKSNEKVPKEMKEVQKDSTGLMKRIFGIKKK